MRMGILRSAVLAGATLALPILASAATLNDTIKFFNNMLNALIALFILVAILVFFWGLINYLLSVGGAEKSKGLLTMFYGVIAIFVMVSIWGIIALLQNTFGVSNGKAITPAGIEVNLPSN
jgi:hypothetical protein